MGRRRYSWQDERHCGKAKKKNWKIITLEDKDRSPEPRSLSKPREKSSKGRESAADEKG